MIRTYLQFSLFAALLFSMQAAVAETDHPADHPAEKRKFNLPPSADLHYQIKVQQSGLRLNGDAVLKWHAGGGKFLVDTETRAPLFGKILDEKSEGTIDDYGLAPASFVDKRFHKDATTTSFNRDSRLISFSVGGDTYPIKGGEQDRNSAIWQLIAIARGAHGKFKADTEWRFFVAGQHDAEAWSFKVDAQEVVRTPFGNLNAVHVIKAPPPDAKGQQIDIWLAPSLEWYPVRLRFTEPNGDYIEQLLDTITKLDASAANRSDEETTN
ncbi:MAG: DUF3108 domain-containing protein [Burkholderiaceae bacterium]|nr:DUF3108 domain-containing protein [Burkholderiaceae bacterium]